MQAETGASAGSPHKGMMENLVEKAREILPHQITGAEPTHAATSAAYPNTSAVGTTRVGALI